MQYFFPAYCYFMNICSSQNKNVLQEKEINVLMICIVRLWKQTKLDTHLAPALPPRILDNPVRLNNKK